MSGPKSGRYYLNQAQLKEIQRQRELELEKIRIAEEKERNHEKCQAQRAKIVNESNKLLSYCNKNVEERKRATLLANYTGNDLGYNKALDDFEEKIRIFVEKNKPSEADDYSALQTQYESFLRANAYFDIVSSELIELSQGVTKSLSDHLESIIEDDLSSSIAEYLKDEDEKEKNQIRENENQLKVLIETKILEYYRKENISEEFKDYFKSLQKRLSEKDGIGQLREFYELSVLPLIEDCNREMKSIEQLQSLNDLLWDEYSALCKVLNITVDIELKNRTKNDELKKAIDKMKHTIDIIDQKKYIFDTVNETMVEMGYDVLGRRNTKTQSGLIIQHTLYSFDDGTAVEATFSESGQIVMEVAGTDYSDRTPTEMEKSQQYEAMVKFCGEYSELEKRLQKKGILMSNSKRLPPNVEYAQIINLNDYQMQAPAYKRTLNKNKALHNDEI